MSNVITCSAEMEDSNVITTASDVQKMPVPNLG
jgi:hypothetical protein